MIKVMMMKIIMMVMMMMVGMMTLSLALPIVATTPEPLLPLTV